MRLLPPERRDWYSNEHDTIKLHRLRREVQFCTTMIESGMAARKGRDHASSPPTTSILDCTEEWTVRKIVVQQRTDKLAGYLSLEKERRLRAAVLATKTTIGWRNMRRVVYLAAFTPAFIALGQQAADEAMSLISYQSLVSNATCGLIAHLFYLERHVCQTLVGPEEVIDVVLKSALRDARIETLHVLSYETLPDDEGVDKEKAAEGAGGIDSQASLLTRLPEALAPFFSVLVAKISLLHTYAGDLHVCNVDASAESVGLPVGVTKLKQPTCTEKGVPPKKRVILAIAPFRLAASVAQWEPRFSQLVLCALHEACVKAGVEPLSSSGASLTFAFEPEDVPRCVAICKNIVATIAHACTTTTTTTTPSETPTPGGAVSPQELRAVFTAATPVMALHYAQVLFLPCASGQQTFRAPIGEGIPIARGLLERAGTEHRLVISPELHGVLSARRCTVTPIQEHGQVVCYGVVDLGGIEAVRTVKIPLRKVTVEKAKGVVATPGAASGRPADTCLQQRSICGPPLSVHPAFIPKGPIPLAEADIRQLFHALDSDGVGCVRLAVLSKYASIACEDFGIPKASIAGQIQALLAKHCDPHAEYVSYPVFSVVILKLAQM